MNSYSCFRQKTERDTWTNDAIFLHTVKKAGRDSVEKKLFRRSRNSGRKKTCWRKLQATPKHHVYVGLRHKEITELQKKGHFADDEKKSFHNHHLRMCVNLRLLVQHDVDAVQNKRNLQTIRKYMHKYAGEQRKGKGISPTWDCTSKFVSLLGKGNQTLERDIDQRDNGQISSRWKDQNFINCRKMGSRLRVQRSWDE